MASVVNIDTSSFENELESLMDLLDDKETLLRPICVELAGIMNNRIHEEGRASDGSRIGSYKNSYLAIREKHNHSASDKKVVLVLTRKLSNSWGAFSTDRGYGVGFTDNAATEGVTGLKKIQYAEQNFGKKIGELTKEEQAYADERLNEIVNQMIQESGGR